MKHKDRKAFEDRKRRLSTRLDREWQPFTTAPVVAGSNVRYEVTDRTKALGCGGIGMMHELVRAIRLPEAINRRLRLFRRHRPYHESDHVLTMCLNVLTGGTRLEDIEALRNDESFLDTIGAHRIPGPTTCGDFLRRFRSQFQVDSLHRAIHDVRTGVWKHLPDKERELARVDIDGTVAPTHGRCKKGIGLSYKGVWGYHPLVVTLANTQEILYTVNRPGNSVSHSGAARVLDRMAGWVQQGGFKRVRFRGDTDFSLTRSFDGWTQKSIEFVFGIDANPSFVRRAESLSESKWKRLERQPRRTIKTRSRRRPENVKERIVVKNGYKNLVLEKEEIAEFKYSPKQAKGTYRMIVLRKTITVKKGQRELFDEIRYFFYVTNVSRSDLPAAEVVFEANERCQQENIIEQMKNGTQALRMPSDRLLANGAYMAIASLAWNLKVWLALALRDRPEAAELHRMEFRRFVNSIIRIPCQVVKGARRVALRVLAYSRWIPLVVDGTRLLQSWRLA